MNQQKQPKVKKKRKLNGIRILWIVFIGGLLAAVLVIMMANYGLLGEMPSIEQLQNPNASEASQIYADDGTLMGKIYSEDRINVSFDQISPHVIQALVATEDERFYQHSGIDPRSLARALFSLGGEGGASTITMQTAKNLFTDYRRNAFIRIIQKLKESIIAIKLERNFTKNEIVTLYLNTVPFGDNVYGIRNAARTFFSVSPDKLTISQSAVLIGMLKASTTYNPRLHMDKAVMRRNVVVNQMVRNNFVKPAEAEAIKQSPIVLNYHKMSNSNGLAPYFRMELLRQLKAWVANPEHKKPDGTEYNLYRDGLRIYTTINPNLQRYAESAVSKHMSYMQQLLNKQENIKDGSIWKNHERTIDRSMKRSQRWKSAKANGMSDKEIENTFHVKTKMKVFAWNKERQTDTVMTPYDSIKYTKQMLQAGLMAMDPISGEVKAWVGGIDFKTYKFDHVNVHTKRQVGSTIKPLLYSLAIEKGGFTPNTPVEDVQQHFAGYGNVPATATTCTGRTMDLSEALAESRNCATAYIMKQLGPEGNDGAVKFVDFMKTCGITSKIEPYPSIALGSAEISLYEMMQAYSMFPGRGFTVQPMMITRIEDSHHNILYTSTPKRKEVISDITSNALVSMMEDVIDHGTGRRMARYDVPGDIAGKTGTTNDNSDAWFIGYTPQLLVGVWTGCDSRFIRFNSTAIGQGASLALPIWAYFFQKAYKDESAGLNRSQHFNIGGSNPAQSIIYDWANDIQDSTDSIQNNIFNQPNIKGQEIGPESDSNIDNNEEQNELPLIGGSSSGKTKAKAVMPARKKVEEKKEPEKKGFLRKIFGGGKNKDKK